MQKFLYKYEYCMFLNLLIIFCSMLYFQLLDLKAELFRKQEEFKQQKLQNQETGAIKGKHTVSNKVRFFVCCQHPPFSLFIPNIKSAEPLFLNGVLQSHL